MFHQVEGICVGENINFSHLKDLIYQIILKFLEKKLKSASGRLIFLLLSLLQKWIFCESGKWLEILGCGLVNPIVLENCNIDSD